MISSRATRDRVDTLIPWMLMLLILLHPAKEKFVIESSRGRFKRGGAHFHWDRNVHANPRNSNGASCSPRVVAKERVRMVWEKGHSKGNLKGPKRAKGSYMGKTSKWVYLVLKPEIRDKFRNSGICTDVSH